MVLEEKVMVRFGSMLYISVCVWNEDVYRKCTICSSIRTLGSGPRDYTSREVACFGAGNMSRRKFKNDTRGLSHSTCFF